MQPRTISAKFAGKCAGCRGHFAKGVPIIYTGVAWHPKCYQKQEPTAPPPPPPTQTDSWLSNQPPPMHQQNRYGGVVHYDSVSQAVADFKRVVYTQKKLGRGAMTTSNIISNTTSKFYTNDQRPSEVCHALETHDARYVTQVLEALDKIPDQIFESFASKWLPTHWGTRLSVGDYITGSPAMFRRRQSVPEAQAPINVYVDITASVHCSAKTLAQRGALILAAIERLQMHRAVSLHLVVAMEAQRDTHVPNSGNGYIVIDVPSPPISIAEFSYPICDSAFFRLICLSLGAHYYAYNGWWPYDKSVATHRKILGLAPNDVWLEALHEINTYMLATPDKWLQTHFGNLLGESQTLNNVAIAEKQTNEYDEVPF